MTARPEAQATAEAPARPLTSIPSRSDLGAIDLALDVMGVGVFEYDPVSGVHRFSDRCKAIWGFTVEGDVSQDMILGRIHPEDLHLTSRVREALAPGGPGQYSIEHRIVLPGGSIRWVSVSGRTTFAQIGGMWRAVRGYGAMCDITERKLAEQRLMREVRERKIAEQQLYERTSQLRAFIEGAPVPIAIFDRAMRYVAFSRQYVEQRGLSGSDLLGRSVYEVFPNMPAHLKAAHARALKGATERREQDLSVRPDGTREWIRWEVRPWYRADNEVGGLVLFSEFITQRIKAQQALRESQARLELAIHAGELGIYDYDLVEGNITWDARVRRLLGVSPDETITRETFRRALHPDDREKIDKAMEEIFSAGSNTFLAREYRIVSRADGSIRWIAGTGQVYFDAGRPVRIVGTIQDVTDRKRAELALEESAEELRRADQRKDVFLATLSHELRNPLAPIRTAAELLASPKLTGEQVKWVSQVLRRQTGHMASLLDDLLEVTRISRGNLVIRKTRVRLTNIAQSAIESTRPLIDEKRHRLLVSLPADSLMLEADPLRLSQVLSNLLANAAKYTDPGGQIELAATVEEALLVIRVRDNGIGIPREAMGNIFRMFWQVNCKSDRSEGGLGIGLAFVEGVVQLHGGTIEARSDGPGRGSEFIVRLPMGVISETLSAVSGASLSQE
jgi:PAS domain S-box-containing protein